RRTHAPGVAAGRRRHGGDRQADGPGRPVTGPGPTCGRRWPTCDRPRPRRPSRARGGAGTRPHPDPPARPHRPPRPAQTTGDSEMEPFTSHTGRGVSLRRSNVDTDQIIPSDYLKRVSRAGFADGLFAAWRTDPGFVLNQPESQGATILVAGPDFGIGSSRQHA